MPYIGNTIRAADDYRLIDDISSSFNGSTTSFALQVAGSAPVPFPKSPQQVLISVNGVIQEPDPTGASGFNLVGTNIVFSSAPTNGHAFFGIIYATADYLNAGGTNPAGSVGAPSITFIGDEDTGLYRKGSGSIGFVSDATEIANTDSNGITISSGNLILGDSAGASSDRVVLGASSDLSIYHNGTNSIIDNNTNDLIIRSDGDDLKLLAEDDIVLRDNDDSTNFIHCINGGSVELFHNGNKKAETVSGGFTVTGTLTATTLAGNIDAVDGDFDGTLEADAITVGGVALNTVIAGVTVTNATNAANITAADESSDTTCFPVFVTAATGNLAPKTGSNLSFNSSSGRLTATSFAGDGSNLTGVGGDVVDDTSPQLGGNLDVNSKNIVFGDSSGETNNRLTFGNATDGDLRIYHNSADSYIQDSGTGDLRILTSQLVVGNPAFTENLLTATADGSVALFHNGTKKLETASFGLRSSDSVYVDEHILIDNDSGRIKLGTSADLQLYHDGSHSRIVDSGTGHLLIQGSQVKIMNAAASENMIRAEENGSVELYQNNNLKLSTVSDGIIVHGGTNVSMDNDGNGQIRIIGNGYSGGIALNASGMNIYHNSTSRSLIFGVNESEVARFDTDGHFRPSANNTRDLGTSSTRWRNIYTNDLNLSNEGGANDVDGTWGSYTIQEGAEDLFLVNKRSGKKYKFNLTEVA